MIDKELLKALDLPPPKEQWTWPVIDRATWLMAVLYDPKLEDSARRQEVREVLDELKDLMEE